MWIKWIVGPGRRVQMAIGVAETTGFKVARLRSSGRQMDIQ